MANFLEEPKIERLAPSLQRWCDEGAEDDTKTAIVRPSFSVDLKDAEQALTTSGAAIQSSGRGAITVLVSPGSLAQVARLPWVVAIEEPRRLFPRVAWAG